MKKYALGFLFNKLTPEFDQKVVLIEKQKPDWQRGLLNGVGGSVEAGEAGIQAMDREFREETGQVFVNWHFVGGIRVPDHDAFVYIYTGLDATVVNSVRTVTNEKILVVPTRDIFSYPRIPNINTWIPLAIACEIVNQMGKAWIPIVTIE